MKACLLSKNLMHGFNLKPGAILSDFHLILIQEFSCMCKVISISFFPVSLQPREYFLLSVKKYVLVFC